MQQNRGYNGFLWKKNILLMKKEYIELNALLIEYMYVSIQKYVLYLFSEKKDKCSKHAIFYL